MRGSSAKSSQKMHKGDRKQAEEVDPISPNRQDRGQGEEEASSANNLHSGSFMVSRYEETSDDEESLLVGSVNAHPLKSPTGFNFSEARQSPSNCYDFTKKDPANVQRAIHQKNVVAKRGFDHSLTRLFKALNIAYHSGSLPSPKFRNFKGLKFTLKDKLRLNNIVWREWHKQYIKHEAPQVVNFTVSVNDTHTRPEAIVLEGKYWKRKLANVSSEYMKWRVFFKDNLRPRSLDQPDVSELLERVAEQDAFRLIQTQTYDDMLANGPATYGSGVGSRSMDFTDTLFSGLPNPGAFNFPVPRDVAPLGREYTQPGLSGLQPSLDDFMDTIDPFRDLLQSDLLSSLDFLLPPQPGSDGLSTIIEEPRYQNYSPLGSRRISPSPPSMGSMDGHSMMMDHQSEQQHQQQQHQQQQQQQLHQHQQQPQQHMLRPPTLTPNRISVVSAPGASQLPIEGGDSMMTQTHQLPFYNSQPDPSKHFIGGGGNAPLPVMGQGQLVNSQVTPPMRYSDGNSSEMQPGSSMVSFSQLNSVCLPAQSQVSIAGMHSQSPSTSMGGIHQSPPGGFTQPQQANTVINAPAVGPGFFEMPNVGGSQWTATVVPSSTTSVLCQGVGLAQPTTVQLAQPTTVLQIVSPVTIQKQLKQEFVKPAPVPRRQRVLIPRTQPTASSVAASPSGGSLVSHAQQSVGPSTSTSSTHVRSTARVSAQPSVGVQPKRASHAGGSFLAQLLTKGTITDIPAYQNTGVVDGGKTSGKGLHPLGQSAGGGLGLGGRRQTTMSAAGRDSTNRTSEASNPMTTGGSITPPVTSGSYLQSSITPSLGAVSLPVVGLPLSSSQSASGGEPSYPSLDFLSHLDNPSVQNTSPLSDDARSPGTDSDGRSRGAVSAEHVRRGRIKGGFDVLDSIIPNLIQNPNSKVSKAGKLIKTAEHVRKVKAERVQMQEEADLLKKEIAALNASISTSQSQLPATGVPITRQRSDQMERRFREYVGKRTQENWKFYMFSEITHPLFTSYHNTVSTTNMEDFYRTTLAWVDQHCTLPTLRASVTQSLCKLCTNTSLLSDQSRVPQEALELAMRDAEDSS